ncbi:uncharacterized protein JCM15063_000684 [Sporobolomyces koalae]|uniref:uncharacterized protein n=1 Tax=Sporobolomyces koalae TaxID=500713 RepID=UPI00317BF584
MELSTPDASLDVSHEGSYMHSRPTGLSPTSSPAGSAPAPFPHSLSQNSVEPEPTLSAASSPARSTSDVDSLVGLPFSQVETVALDLIANAPPSHEEQLKAIGGGVDAFDLPRKSTTIREELVEQEKKAIEFLRRKVQDMDQDDWMYSTPAVFGPPRPLGLQTASVSGLERGREFEEGVGWDDKDGNGTGWIDRAFNLESYRVEGLSGTLNELDVAREDPAYEEPPAVEDWQGAGTFSDSLGEGGYSFTG